MNAEEHLPETAWKTPDSYGGFNPVGDYLILSRNRDSSILEESNWAVACASLGAVDHDSGNLESRPPVYTFRAGHWAVGWVEHLLVRPDAPDATLKEAGEIICSLADYPVLSDEDYSEREFNASAEIWERASVADRVYYLQRAGLPIWSARRDTLPDDPTGSLSERLLSN
jgi:hypothetical protein